MSSLTDKPLARANEHLASARYAEAAGAFRAVLHIDPHAFQAHFGLADALVGRGQPGTAVEGLVEAAESCTTQDDHAAALTLYGKALSIDPSRLELHLDVAMAEAALGREDAAKARLENLAEIYMQAGRTDEAAEMYRFLASWEAEEEEQEAEDDDESDLPAPRSPSAGPGPASADAQAPAAHSPPSGPPAAHPPVGASAGVPLQVPTTETVVVPTILITPDGELLQLSVGAQTDEVPTTKSGDTVPPELIEAVHSKPIDLDDITGLHQVEGTVVAFPPPPPALSEEAKAAGAEHSREDLEAAVAAAISNLALLEEEDETVIMQRPIMPRRRRVLPAPRPAPASPPESASPPPKPNAARGADGRLRLRPAPRPKAAPPAQAPAPAATPSPAAGARPPARSASPRPRTATPPPGAAGRPPAPPGRPRTATPPPAPGRPPPSGVRPRTATPPPGATRPTPADGRPRGAPGPRPRPSPAGRHPSPAGATAPPKPVRPNNPLVERLRRRAGLQQEGATGRAAKPIGVKTRATESISVRSRDDGDSSE